MSTKVITDVADLLYCMAIRACYFKRPNHPKFLAGINTKASAELNLIPPHKLRVIVKNYIENYGVKDEG